VIDADAKTIVEEIETEEGHISWLLMKLVRSFTCFSKKVSGRSVQRSMTAS